MLLIGAIIHVSASRAKARARIEGGRGGGRAEEFGKMEGVGMIPEERGGREKNAGWERNREGARVVGEKAADSRGEEEG